MAFILDSDSIMTPNSPVLVTSNVSPGLVSVSSNTFIRSPVVTSVNLTYSKPMIGTYESLNNKMEVHERFAKYYYFKMLDNWLYDELTDVLNYLVVENKTVKIIKNLSEYKPNNIKKDTDDTVKLKSDFIGKEVMTLIDMLDFLTKFVDGTDINWVDLPKNEFWLRRALENKLIKLLKGHIST